MGDRNEHPHVPPTASRRWLCWLSILFGVLAGVGLFTFQYAEGLSYFSPDPNACANCHIMQPSLDSWQKASHHTVATCVECHLPDSFVPKYLAKADNGYRHSKGFTFQDFKEPLRISPRNAAALEANCVRCHRDFVHGNELTQSTRPNVSCVHCHASVGHGSKTGMGRIYSGSETKGAL